MSFNPDKSEHMKITHKHNPILFNYSLKNQPIKEVPSAKYVGITITNKLTWSTHINNITNKALSTKAFSQRKLRSCPSHLKLQCYNTMIRPILEYANTVWSTYTKKDIAKIQRQSARFIMADYSHHNSVTNVLKTAQLSTPKNYFQPYPVLQNHSQPYQHPLIRSNGYNFMYQRSPSKISTYLCQKIIIIQQPRAIRIWNPLPKDTIWQQSLS